jgi:hypothetical protein
MRCNVHEKNNKYHDRLALASFGVAAAPKVRSLKKVKCFVTHRANTNCAQSLYWC